MEGVNQEFLIHIKNVHCASEAFNQHCLGNISTLFFEVVTGYLEYIHNKRIRAMNSSLNPLGTPPHSPAFLIVVQHHAEKLHPALYSPGYVTLVLLAY